MHLNWAYPYRPKEWLLVGLRHFYDTLSGYSLKYFLYAKGEIAFVLGIAPFLKSS